MNISSNGVLVETNVLLPHGNEVELVIDWPVLLNRQCGLNLVVSGKVVGSRHGAIAVQFKRYQFRTHLVPQS